MTAQSSSFSAAAPPFYSAAALAALDILDSSEGQKRLSKLRSNASLLRKELAKAFDGDALLSVVGTNIEVDLEDDLDVPFVLLEGASSTTLDGIIDATYEKGYAVSLATPPADDAVEGIEGGPFDISRMPGSIASSFLIFSVPIISSTPFIVNACGAQFATVPGWARA